jgi:hypothetical protein
MIGSNRTTEKKHSIATDDNAVTGLVMEAQKKKNVTQICKPLRSLMNHVWLQIIKAGLMSPKIVVHSLSAGHFTIGLWYSSGGDIILYGTTERVTQNQYSLL